MVESFENTHNNSSEKNEGQPEDVGGSPEVSEPEFIEKNIDRGRLKTAIEIALDGSTSTRRFAEEKALNFEAMDEKELRSEVRRAEREGKESEILRLEELILGREKEKKSESLVEEEATVSPSDSLEKQEKKTETNENESEEERESVNEVAPEEKVKRTDSYAERLSQLAQEKDPLGLARVALQETLQELGATEVTYMKAGPFEELVARDKLEVVREFEAFKEKTRKNGVVSERDHAIHLKGLIYNKIDETAGLEEGNHEQLAQEIDTEVPREDEALENSEKSEISESVQDSPQEETSLDPVEKLAVETQEEVLASAPDRENPEVEESISAELNELKESALLNRVMQTLRDSALARLEAAEKNKEDAHNTNRVMDFLDKQVRSLFDEGKKGVEARSFVSGLLETFLSETDLSLEERAPYRRVRELLSKSGTSDSFEQAA